jgi:2-keto-4-pentenoate hydratase/2-oxohepta-3-ene-1,7-dioic acid hydratase in catechol pathway
MKLATIARAPGRSAVAAVVGDRVVDLSPALETAGRNWTTLSEMFDDGGLPLVMGLQSWARDNAGSGATVDATEFLPPLPRPWRILAVAANYKAHVVETKVIEVAEREESSPWFFDKPIVSLNPHRAPIRLPASLAESVDWEGELGVVIGKRAHRVSVDEALDHVAAYTAINDISARALQVAGRTKIRDRDKFHDWLHGKWFDTFCCVGPWIVTADEIPDPADLTIDLTVNGQSYQHASTGEMIFKIAEIISFASQISTLSPGDLIATGTPNGVGKATGRFLTPGDVVSLSITGIGTLTNPVADV